MRQFSRFGYIDRGQATEVCHVHERQDRQASEMPAVRTTLLGVGLPDRVCGGSIPRGVEILIQKAA